MFPHCDSKADFSLPFYPVYVFRRPAFCYTVKATPFLSDIHVRVLENHLKPYIIPVDPCHLKTDSEFCDHKGPSSVHFYSFKACLPHIAADTLTLFNFSKPPTFTILIVLLFSFSCCKGLSMFIL